MSVTQGILSPPGGKQLREIEMSIKDTDLMLRKYVLASAPDIVSLLTTRACTSGSQPVGPYTSCIGTI